MSVSNAAYSKGRAKIMHTAFIELNQVAIAGVTYAEEDLYKRYKGFRLLAVDGCKVRLPNTEDIKKEFGTYIFKNQLSHVTGENAFALASVLYDVENKIAIDAVLAPMHTSEKDLAIGHLAHTQKNDLFIFDRGYGGYELMSAILANKGDFVIRLSSSSFKQAAEMYIDASLTDNITIIKPQAELLRKQAQGAVRIANKLKVRFVKVILNTGEVEILVTSLIDQTLYPHSIFKELYWKRWGVETFYAKLKTRLELENFTGLSAESVKQDFYSSVFLTGLESILTEDIDKALQKKNTVHTQKVNKAVSFNLIKDRAFDIILEKKSIDEIITELETLFLTSPTLYRPEKETPRIKVSLDG